MATTASLRGHDWLCATLVAGLVAASGCSQSRSRGDSSASVRTKDAAPSPPLPPATPSASSASTRPACTSTLHAGFEAWADTPASVHLLDGTALVSDGQSVALETNGALVQDGLLTATSDCADGDRFEAFGGRLPDAAWALRSHEGARRLYLFAKRGWRASRTLGSARTLLRTLGSDTLLVVERSGASAKRSGYELQALGGKTFALTHPSAACPRGVAEPQSLATNRRGDIVLLGASCVTPGAVAVERYSPDGTSELIALPSDLAGPVLTVDAEGSPLVAGGRAGRGVVLVRRAGAWVELDPLAAPVIALGATSSNDVWAAVAATSPGATCSVPGAPAEFTASNLYRKTTGGWSNVALPQSAGAAREISVRAADDVWVTTERALFRTKRASAPLRWSHAGQCPLPVTGAKPYTYRPLPPNRALAERPDNLAGSDCTHFLLVDSTSEPRSPRFEQIRAALEGAELYAAGMREGSANYDAALAHPNQVRFGSPSPFVTHELDRYHWGIWADPLGDGPRVTAYLREKFPDSVRELCAAPLPIRLDALRAPPASPR